MDVHLRDLRALIAVAEEGSVTAAADRLHVAQPALSKRLLALERELGVSLFVRLPRGVALTEAGQLLLGPARAAMAAWDSGVTALQQLSSSNQLVVGMQTAVGRGLQRRALARFRELAPGVLPALRLVSWDDPTAGLSDGSSDVAFIWLPGPVDGLDCLTIAVEPRSVAVPAGHPLAARERIQFSDLLDEPFVALPATAGPLRDFWLATDHRAGRPAVIGAVVLTADAALEAVAAGLGLVLIAAGNVPLYDRPGITTRPVAGLTDATLALAWRADDRRLAVASFVRAVDESLVEQDS
ncbi:MAG: LysR family transcriptional regulator [Nakamurella sp.]